MFLWALATVGNGSTPIAHRSITLGAALKNWESHTPKNTPKMQSSWGKGCIQGRRGKDRALPMLAGAKQEVRKEETMGKVRAKENGRRRSMGSATIAEIGATRGTCAPTKSLRAIAWCPACATRRRRCRPHRRRQGQEDQLTPWIVSVYAVLASEGERGLFEVLLIRTGGPTPCSPMWPGE